MFRKSFNVKNNTNLRNSDVRKLFQRLGEEVPDGLPTLDKKAQIAKVKIVDFLDDTMNVYLFDKVPMLFEFSETGVVYPTVFYMWQFPKAYPVLLVHEPVLQYLENGADLMLPGVIKSDLYTFPAIRKGGPVAIALFSSSESRIIGPIAVGCSLMSSDEMFSCGFQGKGVQVLHVFRDFLWEFGPRGQPNSISLEEFNEEGKKKEEIENGEEKEVADNSNSNPLEETQSDEEKIEEVVEPMENLLRRCFFAGLKHRLKKSGNLPIEINNETGDDIVTLQKKKKGEEYITTVKWDHEFLRNFELTDEKIVDEAPPIAPGDKFDAPVVLEYCAVTEPVLPVFQKVAKTSKGDLLTTSQIREILTNYVKSNELNQGKIIKMDPLLADVSRIKTETSDWNTLIQNVQSKMTKTWVIRWSDGREFVRKVHSPKIEFKVETRSGNKKVTIINNLSVFGIQIKTISHQIMRGIATSVTSNPEAVNCEGPQVIVQGNQIHFISELLLNKYGLDKKYIVGMDLAPKKRR
ncbi:unnamed protein product [Caenorhabditis bovis]|uniref:SUI1 domain-containing protein n=1 Tax=Caenorhabditis bovis TaxID=2654633 RepID=A0A8S1FG38_9PELO|nr:unnamed protein product [Caenorhabditis bovis]